MYLCCSYVILFICVNCKIVWAGVFFFVFFVSFSGMWYLQAFAFSVSLLICGFTSLIL